MKYRNYSVDCYDDLRQMLRASVKTFGAKTLFMQKKDGKYRSVSYAKYYTDVNGLGTALLGMGLAGKKIILMGENCYAWAVAYMAVVCGVGTVVPLDAELTAKEAAHLAAFCEADAVICADSHLDKFISLGEHVRKIPFSALKKWIQWGSDRVRAGDRSYFDAEIHSRETCAILFPSGGCEDVRGVMLSHRNLCFNVSEISQMVYVDEKDTFLSVLPLHHIYECTCGFLCPISRGCAIAFSDGLQSLGRMLKEVSPTVVICVPSVIDGMYERIWRHIEDCQATDQIRRMIAVTNSIPNLKAALAAKKKAFSAIHNSFGGKLRLLISGGASATADTVKGFRELGIPVLQGYGMTECSPVVALNRDTCFRDDSVGLCTPNALLDIAEMQEDGTGEIRYRGDGVMVGYYKMPEQTRAVIRDGWFYTGDMGYLDSDGFLYVTGRKKNAIDLGDGRLLFPEELEIALCSSLYIKEAIVVNYPDERDHSTHIVALIFPNQDALKETYGEAVSETQIDNALRRVLAEVNGALPPYKRIETFLIRDKEFPKTSTRKIRRAGLAEESFAAWRERNSENKKIY